jgi:hypothetical protein
MIQDRRVSGQRVSWIELLGMGVDVGLDAGVSVDAVDSFADLRRTGARIEAAHDAIRNEKCDPDSYEQDGGAGAQQKNSAGHGETLRLAVPAV